MVQLTAGVAMLPARVIANSLSRDARLMSRTFEEAANRVGRGLEVGAASLNRSAQTLSYGAERTAASIKQAITPPVQIHAGSAAQRTAGYQRDETRARPSGAGAAPAPAQAINVPPPQVDILPTSVLSELTEDQAGLQRAAQSEAFSAPVGEEIYWEIDGRTGTAMTKSEDTMGSFVCRSFVQTLTLEDGSTVEGEAVMCRNDSGVWTASF